MTTARRAQQPDTDSFANSFANALHASGPDPERKSKLALYAFLVGQWEMHVTSIAEDGTAAAKFTPVGYFAGAPFRMCG